MEKLEMLYEGKAKKVFKTNDSKKYFILYKDDATAFDGKKKGTIQDKGQVNNQMSAIMFKIVEQAGIETHFQEQIDERSMIVKAVEIVPVEVIVRNIATGSLTRRLGIKDGKILTPKVLEFCYKSDELGDPQMNDTHVLAMNLATEQEMAQMRKMALKVNQTLTAVFEKLDLTLVDFKLEFGRFENRLILADEISPDTCRLWDTKTKERMDKDRFRQDLGNVKATYQEVLKRVKTLA